MNTASFRPSAYDMAALQAGLRTAAIGRAVHYEDSISSTNSAAVALAQERACHGTLVLADAQTVGRGRRGRPWHSPPGLNLYCSVILRLHPEQADHLTIVPLASALAVGDAIFDTAGIRCRLKWPNDVLIGDKKVAGILCESPAGRAGPIVVIGIGINVNSHPEDFPADLSDGVTTLIAERGSPIDRTILVSTLMNRLEDWMARVSPQRLPDLLAAYRGRCATLGQYVRATFDQADMGEAGMIEGIAEAIGTDGSLHIRPSTLDNPGRPSNLVEVRSADIVHLRNMTGTVPMR